MCSLSVPPSDLWGAQASEDVALVAITRVRWSFQTIVSKTMQAYKLDDLVGHQN
jgi:hypothetical protein